MGLYLFPVVLYQQHCILRVFLNHRTPVHASLLRRLSSKTRVSVSRTGKSFLNSLYFVENFIVSRFRDSASILNLIRPSVDLSQKRRHNF